MERDMTRADLGNGWVAMHTKAKPGVGTSTYAVNETLAIVNREQGEHIILEADSIALLRDIFAKIDARKDYTVILGGPDGMVSNQRVRGLNTDDAIREARFKLGRSDARTSWAVIAVYAGHLTDLNAA